ncbi:MAG: 1,4-alpha-glucan-branching protein [Flavobacteriia bacterium]|nr:1,4-alpha-glucan-branching protein [Flavobacteriia bacterium]
MLKRFVLVCAILGGLSASSQVTLAPTFVTQNDTVTVTFDATAGNAALVGATQVFAHTGVITNLSSSSTDWRHVQGTWGTNDAKVRMTSIGNNRHEIKYHINTFYNVPGNETVQALAFVFRDQSGNTVGRAADGSDIFVPIYSSSFATAITQPTSGNQILSTTDSINLEGQSSINSTLTFYVNGNAVASDIDTTLLRFKLQLNTLPAGTHTIVLTADTGGTAIGDTLEIFTQTPTPVQAKPSWGTPGITWRNDSLYLELRAPGKPYAYVIGSFNNWEISSAYQMNKTPNDSIFWIVIDNLPTNQGVSFQYYVGDEAIRIADPYSTMVLDPWNDQWIDDSTFANIPTYPFGLTSEPVTYTHPNPNEYQWDNSYTYEKPNQEELVVYELLVRDFRAAHDYNAVIERLDYLQDMGINAIELMPVMEFEGNESWGYNPSFFFAPDKYYGPQNELKRLVDSCHRRGIAVILDIVVNHAFGQNPMVRLYWDGVNNRPATNSPWFNPVAKHDFNVGYDFNHESEDTKYFTRRLLRYWLEEFNVDGYRMDLSKGLTQRNTLGNVGLWGQYDQSRVDILTDYANIVWSVDPDNYFICEHFADNSEETALSDLGMMLWGNMNHQYNEGTMGYNSNFYGVTHKSRGWSDMHAIGYMESHDEERLIFRNIEFGNGNSNYTTDVLDTALERVKLAATFFLTVPGPKMIWQFGELGYDYSIDFNGRVGNKPIRWDYFYADERRRSLYDHFVDLGQLRTRHDIFRNDGTWEMNLGGYAKRLGLSNDTMNVIVLGNFNIINNDINPAFDHAGKWYEYFSGDSIEVVNTDSLITLKPGEYRMYSDVRLDVPSEDGDTSTPVVPTSNQVLVYPTIGGADGIHFEVETVDPDFVEIYVYDLSGNIIWEYSAYGLREGIRDVIWNGQTNSGRPVANGMYIYRINRFRYTEEGKLILRR